MPVDGARGDLAQSVKVLEEAVEFLEACSDLELAHGDMQDCLDEAADVCMALAGWLASNGVTDMTEARNRCERRQLERGRYGKHSK